MLQRNDAHKLIEECMIAANVEAAKYLMARHVPSPFRIHERPPEQKYADLLEFLKEFKLRMPAWGRVDPEGRCPAFRRPQLEPFAPRPAEWQIAEERITVPGPKTRDASEVAAVTAREQSLPDATMTGSLPPASALGCCASGASLGISSGGIAVRPSTAVSPALNGVLSTKPLEIEPVSCGVEDCAAGVGRGPQLDDPVAVVEGVRDVQDDGLVVEARVDLGGDGGGGVHDQDVAGVQVVGQVAEPDVVEPVGRADEQAYVVASEAAPLRGLRRERRGGEVGPWALPEQRHRSSAR